MIEGNFIISNGVEYKCNLDRSTPNIQRYTMELVSGDLPKVGDNFPIGMDVFKVIFVNSGRKLITITRSI